MKSLYHILQKRILQNAVLFIFSLGFLPIINAQKQTRDWFLPQHQLNVLYGTSGQASPGNHNIPSSNTVLGLAYTYNVTPFLFASFDYQFSYSNYDLMTTKKNYILKVPAFDNGIKVSIVNSANLFEDRYGQPKPETNLYELTNNDGFMRRNSYNFTVGYMKATARNVLRIGVGYSYTSVTGRFTESLSTTLQPIHTLYVGEEKDWVGNVMLSYDFYFNQNVSLGVRFNGFMVNNPNLAGCLTLGYSPVFNAKPKKNPRV
jgi:hypothetical protein